MNQFQIPSSSQSIIDTSQNALMCKNLVHCSAHINNENASLSSLIDPSISMSSDLKAIKCAVPLLIHVHKPQHNHSLRTNILTHSILKSTALSLRRARVANKRTICLLRCSSFWHPRVLWDFSGEDENRNRRKIAANEKDQSHRLRHGRVF